MHTETRKVLWLLRAVELAHSQDMDREIERLEASVAKLRAASAERRRRAGELSIAAEILGKIDESAADREPTSETSTAKNER